MLLRRQTHYDGETGATQWGDTGHRPTNEKFGGDTMERHQPLVTE